MFETIKASVVRWNAATTERQKLQHLYIAIVVVMIVVAGLVSLVNPDAGHNIVLVPLACVIAFVLNGVAWHLLNSLLLSRLPATPRNRRK